MTLNDWLKLVAWVSMILLTIYTVIVVVIQMVGSLHTAK